jgi:hypothetical protein
MTKISSIELDTSIQCRAAIDSAVVNEYAEKMESGDKFPPVVLFGTSEKSWIGDGWHRVLAARQIGAERISSELKPGGRPAALKYALGANAAHGHRRSNADKRRCVEIALKEFGSLSSRAIAEMCGVGDDLVLSMRKQVPENGTSHTDKVVTGKDGKQYSSRKGGDSGHSQRSAPSSSEPSTKEPKRHVGPPCDGMNFARLAIIQLEQIRPEDTERQQAFNHVKQWIKEHETQT